MVVEGVNISVLFPLLPQLIIETTQVSEISSIAILSGLLSGIYAFIQFFSAPLIGHLSDRWGRKVILVMSISNLVIQSLVFAFSHSFYLLLLARSLSGFAAATQSTVYTVASDCSKPNERAGLFGKLGGMFGLGFILGPSLGGSMSILSVRAPFFLVCAINCITLALIVFYFSDTRGEKQTSPQVNNNHSILSLIQIKSIHAGLSILISYTLFNLANSVYPTSWAFFTTAHFSWGPSMIGLSLSLYGTGFIFTQALLLPLLTKKFPLKSLIMSGLTIELITTALLTQIQSTWLVIPCILITTLGSIAQPCLQTLLINRSHKGQYGLTQGLLNSGQALGFLISPLLYSGLFFIFTHPDSMIFYPPAPFVLSFICFLTAAIIVGININTEPIKPKTHHA